MSSQSDKSHTRRRFLRDASIVAAVSSVGFATEVALADGDEVVIKVLDLGVKPLLSSNGAVVHPGSNATFATFATEGGTALMEFTRCAALKFRSPGDELTAAHALDLDSLPPCDTYEIVNSPWAGDSSLRHFVVTFFGDEVAATHFECLAEDVQANVAASGSYRDIADLAVFVG